MIEIKQVSTKRERKEFLNFPLKLYKKNKFYAPPLYIDEKKLFKTNHRFYGLAEAVYFLAYKDGELSGRICAILQTSSNERWGQKRVRFSRFDCINDQQVADALFNSAEQWAKEKGMEEIVGPLGFSENERTGVLIEGFEEVSPFEGNYNYEYYQSLIENNGYKKEVDFIEKKLFAPKEKDEKAEQVVQKILERNKLRLAKTKNVGKVLRKYGDGIFNVLEQNADKIYGSVPYTKKEKKLMLQNLSIVMNKKFLTIVVNKEKKVVAFAIGIPSISRSVQKSGGKISFPAMFKILHEKTHPKVVSLSLVGVLPEYQSIGVGGILIAQTTKNLAKRKRIKYVESGLIREDDLVLQNQWHRFESQTFRKCRVYVKNI